MSSEYENVSVPDEGEQIEYKNGELVVPDEPWMPSAPIGELRTRKL